MSLAAPNLYDILLRVYDELGELRYGIATGGSSTTLVDSGIGGSNDDWNQGTVFIVEADAAAPEGEYAEVTDYVSSGGTLTFSSTGIDGISSAPASGDEYALASDDFPIDKMRGMVNRSLVRMADIPFTDETLTTAANTKEYAIPAAARQGLRRVYIAQTTTADNEGWVEMFNWRQELGVLIFRQQPVTGKTIKLVRMGPHSRLAANTDTLDALVPLNRIVAEVFYLATVTRVRRLDGGGGPGALLARQLVDARVDLAEARKRWPIWDPGTPFKPILSGRRGRNRRRRAAYGPWIQS